MQKLKSAWAVIQSPVFLRSFNGWSTLFFIALIPVAAGFGWLQSVVFVSYLSIYALVTSSLSAWASGRVEVKQEDSQDGLIEEDRQWISQQLEITSRSKNVEDSDQTRTDQGS